MPAFDDAWLDQLDIPAIPDFSDPTFNPYSYDGADEWFATHRETADNEHLQALILKREELKKPAYLRNIPASNAPGPGPIKPARQPLKPIRSPPNAVNANKTVHKKPEARVGPTVVQKAALSTTLHRPVASNPGLAQQQPHFKRSYEVLNIAKKPLPAPPVVPLKPKTDRPFLLPSHSFAQPSFKRSHEVLHGPKKNGPVVPPHMRNLLRSPLRAAPPRPKSAFGNRRPESQGYEKRSSVEAARAGQYFAGILRCYPLSTSTKETIHPSWK